MREKEMGNEASKQNWKGVQIPCEQEPFETNLDEFTRVVGFIEPFSIFRGGKSIRVFCAQNPESKNYRLNSQFFELSAVQICGPVFVYLEEDGEELTVDEVKAWLAPEAEDSASVSASSSEESDSEGSEEKSCKKRSAETSSDEEQDQPSAKKARTGPQKD